MINIDKTCPTCGNNFIAHRKDKNFCKRLCYRKSPNVKTKYRKRNDQNRDKNKYELKWRYSRLQSSSKKRNLIVSLTLAEYIKLLNDKCYYCSNSVLKETGCGLDRKDNSKGYELNNVLTCCGKCNQIRNIHLTVEEMKIAMEAILKYRMLGRA